VAADVDSARFFDLLIGRIGKAIAGVFCHADRTPLREARSQSKRPLLLAYVSGVGVSLPSFLGTTGRDVFPYVVNFEVNDENWPALAADGRTADDMLHVLGQDKRKIIIDQDAAGPPE